jgi:hypothetical protein
MNRLALRGVLDFRQGLIDAEQDDHRSDRFTEGREVVTIVSLILRSENRNYYRKQ